MSVVFHHIKTRFSVPAFRGFALDRLSYAEKLDWLFDKKRIETRFELFENFVLPSLKQAASGKLLSHSVYFSSDMPDPYIKRLMGLASQYRFVNLVSVDSKRGGVSLLTN